MLSYAVIEILGKQYKVEPGKKILVNLLNTEKIFETDKVLMESSGNIVKLGTPYLKKTLKFEVVGSGKKKIRVAKYSAKANYRKVKGAKQSSSAVKLIVDTREKS